MTAQGGGRGERIADAKPGDVRVLATAAIRIPLDAVRAEAAKAIGLPVIGAGLRARQSEGFRSWRERL